MARLLDATAYPEFGYYYTREFAEIITYINNLIETHNESFLATFHASAIFVNPNGEQVELHMHGSDPVLFDPDMHNINIMLSEIFDEITSPEKYEHIQGSDWSLVPDTFTFWVNTIRYQPNNNPNPNQRNTNSLPPDIEDDDPDCSSINNNDILMDTFLLAIAAHYVEKKRNSTKVLYARNCQRWLENQGLMPLNNNQPKIKITTIANWHSLVNRFHIRIFSNHGNVIYHKDYDNLDNEPINIGYYNRKFKLITDLWGYLKEKSTRHFCNRCKKFHSSSTQCMKTLRIAKSENLDKIEYPEGRHGLIVYADFESIITDDKRHKASGCKWIIINRQHEVISENIINANNTDNVPEYFVKTLMGELILYAKGQNTISTSECQICGEIIGNEQRYDGINFINCKQGSHHKECWEDIRNCAFIYFHNFRGYDSHYLVEELMKHTEISLIRGKSFEKFDLISGIYRTIKYCFKDTFNFFSTSIAKLVPQVKEWKYTPIDYRNNKGVFPYDWFNDFSKLNENKLPPKECWFNDLTNSQINNEEAEKIWKKEKMKKFADYHDFYMTIDVYQLADIFEEFRNTSIMQTRYDPAYFQGAPGYTWFLATNEFNEKFKLIRDIDVYLDIQANIRGGIAQVIQRHCDISITNGEIIYLDVNSLYSHCMEMKLPGKYLGKYEYLPLNWEQLYASDGDMCAFLNVDLYYPEYLHDKHIDMPLAPHKFNDRLCTTFLRKENYLVHSKLLKYYLDNGMILEKFNYLYAFKQEYILKEYVSRNINERRKTNNPALKTLFKLLNNSLYGKTCENKFKHRKYSVKNHFYGIDGKRNPFMFKSHNWMEINNCILSEDDNSNIILDKPIQIGFTILEHAKYVVYNFLYLILNNHPEFSLIYTDTDSIMLHCTKKEPYKILYNDLKIRPFLDFENVPEEWGIKTENTDKISGLWSLEADKPIIEFIGLRAKTYALRFADNTTTLKNKGVVKSAVTVEDNEPLSFESYRDALFEDKEVYIRQFLIRSKMHNIETLNQIKLALSSVDEKRAVLRDKITTIPWGYKGEKYNDENIIQPSADHL